MQPGAGAGSCTKLGPPSSREQRAGCTCLPAAVPSPGPAGCFWKDFRVCVSDRDDCPRAECWGPGASAWTAVPPSTADTIPSLP